MRPTTGTPQLVRVGMPDAAMCAFTSSMDTSRRWKMPAASAAAAPVRSNTSKQSERAPNQQPALMQQEVYTLTCQVMLCVHTNVKVFNTPGESSSVGLVHVCSTSSIYRLYTSAKCSGAPAPLEAMTGMVTAEETASTSSKSKPVPLPTGHNTSSTGWYYVDVASLATARFQMQILGSRQARMPL